MFTGLPVAASPARAGVAPLAVFTLMTAPHKLPFSLPHSARAWGSTDFATTFKAELAHHAACLPLQEALSTGHAVADEPITILIHHLAADASVLRVHVGILFSSILVGCACTGDPSTLEPQTEYAEWQLEIRRADGATNLIPV